MGRDLEMVKVKELEWRGRECWAQLVGRYEINQLSENVWTTELNGFKIGAWYSSEDDAKTSAQQDYKNRVLSLLEPSK